MICQVLHLGLVPYPQAWELQKRLSAQRAADEIPDTLLLLEHPHTYTFGRSGHLENLLWDESERLARGVTVAWVDRGGDVTYHGPGQVVGYPILKLGSPTVETSEVSGETLVRTTSEVFIPEVLIPKADYVGYIRKLEDLIIRSLAHFSLVTGQLAGVTGVFVHPDKESRCAFCAPEKRQTPSKIAAIGVKVDGRGISQHGFAINVAPEMNYFEGIIGCGLKDHPAISMAELLPSPPTVQAVMAEVARQFGKRFEYEMTVTDSGMNQ